MYFFYKLSATSVRYTYRHTLSLHDAIPISGLDARCDFDALRVDGQRLERVADRMFRVLVGEAERTIETGEVDKTPEQSGEPWHRGLARSVVAAFLFGTLRQLLGRRAQHQIGRAHV